MLNDVADVAQSVSVILACMFTIYGIDSWRREFVGKRRMELADEILASSTRRETRLKTCAVRLATRVKAPPGKRHKVRVQSTRTH